MTAAGQARCQGLPGVAASSYRPGCRLRGSLWGGGGAPSRRQAEASGVPRSRAVGSTPLWAVERALALAPLSLRRLKPRPSQRCPAPVKKMKSKLIFCFSESVQLLSVHFNTPYSHSEILADTSENKHMVDLWLIHVEMNKTSSSGVT